ncbi:SoxR reducing system RseC family protein [Desulfatirhabdium butyrativorans]|uniref:SoxR reducing system RseC family protein n=1 Tax=Desulfatirhabdium butyrativorans TaxID=340467 RepID=UPI000416B8DF|nr:SoxR reducing system RseC family protein [Desulfatirhabdium butyrativorans]
MPIEEGVVLKRIDDKGLALVKTVRSTACDHCAAKHACSTQDAVTEMEVEAVNTAQASPGDRVQLSIASRTLLSAAFLLYVLPILAMAAGAALGDHLGSLVGLDPTLSSIALALAAFAVVFCLIRMYANRKASGNAYRPKITRILKRQAEPSP